MTSVRALRTDPANVKHIQPIFINFALLTSIDLHWGVLHYMNYNTEVLLAQDTELSNFDIYIKYDTIDSVPG